MQAPNCIIIHGCPSKPESAAEFCGHWIQWLKKELVSKGIQTATPLMPEPWKPVYENFKRAFEKHKIDKNTILIGHSCGCAFLVRYLGETKREIAKLILVAPWKVFDTKDADPFRRTFYTFKIDETIKKRITKIVMFTANDEHPFGKESLKLYHNALGGEIIELKDRGHYTFSDMKTEEFPELLSEILL